MIAPRDPRPSIDHWFLVELAWNTRAMFYCAGDHPDYAPDYPGDNDLNAITLSTLVAHILSNPGEDIGLTWAAWNTACAGVLGIPTDTLKPLKDVGRVDQLWLFAVKGLVIALSEEESKPVSTGLLIGGQPDPGLRPVEMV